MLAIIAAELEFRRIHERWIHCELRRSSVSFLRLYERQQTGLIEVRHQRRQSIHEKPREFEHL